MKFMRKQMELLTRLALSENPKDQKKLQTELRELLQKSHYPDTVEAALTELGVPPI